MTQSVLCIVPAHNEEQTIVKTIESLQNQTHKCDIIIIADNCTDNTVEVVKSIGVKVYETTFNTKKKSGASNYGFGFMHKYDYVFCMDADTIVDNTIIYEGLKEFEKDPKLGAVCSRAGILPYDQSTTAWQKFLWHLQHVEYAEFDTSRVEKHGKIKVIHGMAAMYKVRALYDVIAYRKMYQGKHTVYNEDNITEDYELTICLKRLGYRVSACMKMNAYTDVPLSLNELWKQRIRWLRGGIDTLREHGMCRATARDITNCFAFWIVICLQAVVTILLIEGLIGGVPYYIMPATLAAIGVIYTDGLYRLKYVQHRTWKDVAVKALFIPQIFYSCLAMVEQVYAYILSFGNIKQEW